MENLLEGLQTERKAVEDERFHLSMERAEAEYQRKQLEEERHELEEQRVRILNEARAQASANWTKCVQPGEGQGGCQPREYDPRAPG